MSPFVRNLNTTKKLLPKIFPSQFRDHSFRAYAEFSEKFTFLTSRQHLLNISSRKTRAM